MLIRLFLSIFLSFFFRMRARARGRVCVCVCVCFPAGPGHTAELNGSHFQTDSADVDLDVRGRAQTPFLELQVLGDEKGPRPGGGV